MAEPTKAGRALFTCHADCLGVCEVWAERDAINAIEAEAVAAERARIRAAVEGLRVRAFVRDEPPWLDGFRQSRNETIAAVLAIVEGEA